MVNQILIKKDSFTKDPSTVKFNFSEGGESKSGFIVFFVAAGKNNRNNMIYYFPDTTARIFKDFNR